MIYKCLENFIYSFDNLDGMIREIYKREFSFWELLSESWDGFIKNIKPIFFVTLIVYLPTGIITSFLVKSPSIPLLIFAIVFGLLGIIGAMAIAIIIKSYTEKETVTVSDALKKALSKWFMALITLIVFGFALSLLVALPVLSVMFARLLPLVLQFLFVIIAFALFVFPIKYYVYWLFTLYAVLFNDKYVGDALSYSKKVVKGRWWKVFFYSFVIAIISYILDGIEKWFLGNSQNILILVAVFTLFSFFNAFFIVFSTLFYLNLEATKQK